MQRTFSDWLGKSQADTTVTKVVLELCGLSQ
jgi:hypothetical protein